MTHMPTPNPIAILNFEIFETNVADGHYFIFLKLKDLAFISFCVSTTLYRYIAVVMLGFVLFKFRFG